MKKIFDLSGKTIIVSGGYGHLGTAMVEAFAEFGACVIVAGRSEEKFIEKFKNTNSTKLIFKNLDILESSSINRVFEEIYAEYGTIDVLVNNACTVRGNSPEQMSDEDWSFSVEAALGSVQKSIRAVIPFMKQRNSGKIINVSSMYGIVSPDFKLYEGDNCEKFLNPSHYGASKAAVIQLTKYYAAYLGKFNIQVNAISPGPFPSKDVQLANPLFINRLKAKTLLNRIGEPKDIAGASLLLASRASDFITGQNLIIDGGWTNY